MLCRAGPHVLDKKIKQNKKNVFFWKIKKNVKNVKNVTKVKKINIIFFYIYVRNCEIA